MSEDYQIVSKHCEALEKRVAFLEARLQQRYEVTVSQYQDRRKYFDKMQEYVLTIFLDLPPGSGLTREELAKEFAERYPHIKSLDAPRRAYELVDQDKLWKHNENGITTFYLKLETVTADV